MINSLPQVISRFLQRIDNIKPTVRRGTNYYFRYSKAYRAKISESGDMTFTYSPNTTATYIIQYSRSTGDLTYHYNTKTFGLEVRNRGKLSYNFTEKYANEAGYFMQSTVQDLTDIELTDIVNFLAIADHFYKLMNFNRISR